ncbi:MAG TPA: excalibur calcium-binding domain-containing protein [Methyloceanibacter sp.]
MTRLVGLAPAYRGQPGYRASHDRDDDGIACEPRPHRQRY